MCVEEEADDTGRRLVCLDMHQHVFNHDRLSRAWLSLDPEQSFVFGDVSPFNPAPIFGHFKHPGERIGQRSRNGVLPCFEIFE
jgi:hypothetical protein